MSNEIVSATYFDDRVYRIVEKGQEHFLASVTTKLGMEEKPFLLKYYADLGWDEARKRLHEAGERGKRIHFALWVYLNGGTVIYNPFQMPFYTESQIQEIKKETNDLFFEFKNQDEMVALWKLQRFFEIVKPKVLETEKTVYSLSEGIAGTLDIVLHIEKGKYDVNGRSGLEIPVSGQYVCDLKSGNVVSDSAWAQIAAYSKAYEEMMPTKIEGGLILHTSSQIKTGIEGFSSLLKTRDELSSHYGIFKALSYVFDQRNPNFGPKIFQFPTMIKGMKGDK